MAALKPFYVPMAKLTLVNRDGLKGEHFIDNTIESLTILSKNKLFSTTNPNKYLIIHIGALGFSGTEGGFKSSKKIAEFIKTLKKPYELIILALDGIFIDSTYTKPIDIQTYVRNLGFVSGSSYKNPIPETDGTYKKLIIVPGYLKEDSDCIKMKAYFDIQQPGATFTNYTSYDEIENSTSNLLAAICKKALDEAGTVFIQSYLNWDGAIFEPLNLGYTNMGSNFENLVSLVQKLYKLDQSRIFLIPHNNRCEKRGEEIVDTVYPFFSEEAVTKFIGNTCLEGRLVGEHKRSRGFVESDFVLNETRIELLKKICDTDVGGSGASDAAPAAAGAGAAGGSRRRRGKKLRRTLRRKGRVWMR